MSSSSNDQNPQTISVAAGAKLIQQGELVAFPTETVYGLGADARNESAVLRIFAIKGRPPTNPLIVHINSVSQLTEVADLEGLLPATRQRLEALIPLWPGPISIVLPKHPSIAHAVTAGGSFVAVRIPSDVHALKLLRLADRPIAAPSANRSNRVSPTSAQHVWDEFSGSVPIVGGAPSTLGLESTVVQPTEDGTVIHRPGYVTPEMIAERAGPVIFRSGGSSSLTTSSSTALVSPGQLALHYAPVTPTYTYNLLPLDIDQVALLGLAADIAPTLNDARVVSRVSFSTVADYAAGLYRTLREFDSGNFKAIAVIPPSETGLGLAIGDRLMRATAQRT